MMAKSSSDVAVGVFSTNSGVVDGTRVAVAASAGWVASASRLVALARATAGAVAVAGRLTAVAMRWSVSMGTSARAQASTAPARASQANSKRRRAWGSIPGLNLIMTWVET